METTQPKRTSIADEFQHLVINDQRLIRRLMITATLLEKQPEKSIPDACQTWASTKATYKCFSNDNINPESLSAGHYFNTIERIKNYPLVLMIQDTTALDFTTHRKTNGLGPYSTTPDTRGLLMHSVLAVSPTGIPLGLLYQDIWTRDPATRGKSSLRSKLPIEAKESFKWLKALKASSQKVPNSVKTVMIADREADIFELFQLAYQENYQLLVRAVQNRRITEEHKLLWEQIRNVPVAGYCTMDIPRQPERNLPPRQAKLSIQFCRVTVCQAHNREKKPTSGIPLYVILAQEIEVPIDETPVQWLLLSNIAVDSYQEAIQKIEWYRERWKIERFHYTLKSGCHVEDLQLETAERLKNAIALYSIVAWRLTWLTYQARVTPDLPCDIILETHEWQALYSVVNKTNELPTRTPTLHEAVRMIAKLGGFLGRKSDGEPGVKVLWRGFQKLNDGLLFIEYYKSSISS